MPFRLAPLLILLALAACSGTPEALYLSDAPVTEERIAVRPATIEVRQVSLPDYAAVQEIAVQGPDGALRLAEGARWADDPARAVTLDLARTLDMITTADVVAEPWPLEALPDMRLDLRVERLVPRADGVLQFSGQVIVSAYGGEFREVVERFDILAPIPGPGVPAIAAARGAAILALSRQVAARLAR